MAVVHSDTVQFDIKTDMVVDGVDMPVVQDVIVQLVMAVFDAVWIPPVQSMAVQLSILLPALTLKAYAPVVHSDLQ